MRPATRTATATAPPPLTATATATATAMYFIMYLYGGRSPPHNWIEKYMAAAVAVAVAVSGGGAVAVAEDFSITSKKHTDPTPQSGNQSETRKTNQKPG